MRSLLHGLLTPQCDPLAPRSSPTAWGIHGGSGGSKAYVSCHLRDTFFVPVNQTQSSLHKKTHFVAMETVSLLPFSPNFKRKVLPGIGGVPL